MYVEIHTKGVVARLSGAWVSIFPTVPNAYGLLRKTHPEEMSSSSKRARICTHERAGPKDLRECLCLIDMNVDEAMSAGMSASCKRLAEEGFIITSCYSGTGAAEMAAKSIMRRINELKRTDGVAICHAACDYAKPSQRALGQHAGMSTSFYEVEGDGRPGPAHIFVNVMDRVPFEARQQIDTIQSDIFAKHAKAKGQTEQQGDYIR